MIHFFEGFEELEGHVSVTVRLPLRRKWKSSNKGLGAGETVAFTDVWMEQDLPMILTLLSKSFVRLDRRELGDINMYLDLSPNLGNILPPSMMTTLLDLWLIIGTNNVFRTILSSQSVEEGLVGITKVVIVVMSAETRVFCPTSFLVNPSFPLLFISMIACIKIS